ncbi:hypothetical protein COK43_14510 [Bacillus cereus]|nr:hypothetical protein COK43_14510 [Bacillus cereus]
MIINMILLFSNLNVIAIEGIQEPINIFKTDKMNIQLERMNNIDAHKKVVLKYTVSNLGEKEVQNISLKHLFQRTMNRLK